MFRCNSTQKEMTGSATLSCTRKCFGGEPRVGNSLYRTDLSSFTMGDSYDQKEMAGLFASWTALASRARTRRRSRDEDVVGKVPATAGPAIRTVAAIVRF